ncbi:MAG: hypothetical protein KA341_06080, partial [Saprospiraceae bacterium]|nr:hypothetical protein [Saprospiraceae bacterium]
MKYKIIVALLMATVCSYAQNDLVRYRPCSSGCGPNDYGDTTIIFATQDVISDYGVRNLHGKKGSKFHQAIDYTVYDIEDEGYAIVAVKGGTVSSVNGGDEYKGITVGNYRYTHIFDSSIPTYGNYLKSGKFILKQVEKVDETDPKKIPWAIIDLEKCRAFCEEAGRTVKISGFCGNTISTVNWVEEGWDIAPIGGSGGFPTHLHLERRNSGKKHDPNQNVQHVSQDFGIELTSKDYTGIKLKYPGTSRNALRLRATMNGGIPVGNDRFSNVTMNLDKADILLQRDGSSDYEHIVGYEGSDKTKIESKLWLGANYNTSITPSDWDDRPYGSWTQTGTYPYAHSSPDKIYDDYFFSDFYTRIDKTDYKNLTDLPINARYNDGKYILKPTITNVRDVLYTVAGFNITLDNFKPYLSRITVNANGGTLYEVER